MNWFFIALISPALWAATNHIDKYLISKLFRDHSPVLLLIFSSLIGLLVAPIICIIQPDILSIRTGLMLLIIANGFISGLSLLPYVFCLKADDASIVAPFFQLIPIFVFILGYFILGETITLNQMLGSILIISGALSLSIGISKGGLYFKYKIFLLMTLASSLFALNGIIFKYVALQDMFWRTVFWEYMGMTIFAIGILIFIKSYRQQFFSVLKKNKTLTIGLNIFNEGIAVIAGLIFSYLFLLVPVVLVWVVNGFQPLFVLIYGIILALFFPKISQESLQAKHLGQKIIAIVIIFLGSYFLNK